MGSYGGSGKTARWPNLGSARLLLRGGGSVGAPGTRHHPTWHRQTPRNLPQHPPRRDVQSDAASKRGGVAAVAAVLGVRPFFFPPPNTATQGPAESASLNCSALHALAQCCAHAAAT